MPRIVVGNYAHRTDVGRVRITNEDQADVVLNADGRIMMIVCDGMGGQNHGELASRLALNIMEEEFKKCPNLNNGFLERFWIHNAIKKANIAIYNEANENPLYKGMGTTLTALIISNKHITIANIGDSRAYMLRDNKLHQLTDDQTYVAYLSRVGQIKEEDIKNHPKKHVLLNALGIYPSLNVDIQTIDYHGEHLMLCSDGLYNNIRDKDLEAIIKTNETSQQKVDQLISLANANGGSDNIAISYWEAENYAG